MVKQNRGYFSNRDLSRLNLILRRQSGFSLVELITVIAVIVILTSIIVVGLRSRGDQTNLDFSAQHFISVCKQARTMIIAGKKAPGEDVPPPGGYGVRIDDEDTFFLFADLDESRDYDAGEEIETIDLPDGIVISSGEGEEVVFEAPDGDMFLTGGSTVTIIFALEDDLGVQKSVRLREAGNKIELL